MASNQTNAPGAGVGGSSGGLRLIFRNRMQWVWRCIDYIEVRDPVTQQVHTEERVLFELSNGGRATYEGNPISDVRCSPHLNAFDHLNLRMRGDNPWYGHPWLYNELIDNRLPGCSSRDPGKCFAWGSQDSFKKEGSRVVHQDRGPGGGFDLVLERGRKYPSKIIDLYLDFVPA